MRYLLEALQYQLVALFAHAHPFGGAAGNSLSTRHAKTHRVGRRKSNADEKNDQALEPIGLEKKNGLWTLETLPPPEEWFDPSEALGEKDS